MNLGNPRPGILSGKDLVEYWKYELGLATAGVEQNGGEKVAWIRMGCIRFGTGKLEGLNDERKRAEEIFLDGKYQNL